MNGREGHKKAPKKRKPHESLDPRTQEEEMKFTRMLMGGMALVLLAASARPQTFEAKHFAKDGLTFDYSKGWAIIDESNSDAQQLTLRRDDSDAMIKLFVHRGKVDSPERMSQARSRLVD